MAVILIVLATAIIVGIFRPTHTPSVSSNSQPTVATSSVTVTPHQTLEATEKENTLGINTEGLDENIFLLEEALNLPPGTERDRKIQSLSTDEGFASVRKTPNGPLSNAEKAAQRLEFEAIRDCSQCIQVEPLDTTTLSAYSEIQVNVLSNGQLINSYTSKRITSWVNVSGEWKFAFLQQ
jgi:hypothetical protein